MSLRLGRRDPKEACIEHLQTSTAPRADDLVQPIVGFLLPLWVIIGLGLCLAVGACIVAFGGWAVAHKADSTLRDMFPHLGRWLVAATGISIPFTIALVGWRRRQLARLVREGDLAPLDRVDNADATQWYATVAGDTGYCKRLAIAHRSPLPPQGADRVRLLVHPAMTTAAIISASGHRIWACRVIASAVPIASAHVTRRPVVS